MTQCDMILAYIDLYGSITPLEALRECHCMRLASRICDLRKAGHNIVSELVKVEKSDGTITTVARYSLGVV